MTGTSPAQEKSSDPGVIGRIVGMFNIFVDPEGAANNIRLSWSWVAPLLLSSLVFGICGYLLIPLTMRIMDLNPPGNMTMEDYQRARSNIQMMQKVSVFAIPLIAAGMTALLAGVLAAVNAVADISSRFRDNFSLLAHGGLIGTLGYAVGFLVVKLKGSEVQSLKELSPGFGLDLLLGDSANKFVFAALHYFSLFTLLYMVMLGLTFAALARISKGKAFAATAPVWILGLLFTMVGAIFQR